MTTRTEPPAAAPTRSDRRRSDRGAGAAVRRRSPRLVFWLSWGLLTALSGVWAVANPMAAAPDEPAHIVRAAALVRGAELVPAETGVWTADVPRIYGLTHAMPGCYAFRKAEPASCLEVDWGDVAALEPATTSAGNYNPLYYAVVGLPALLEPRNADLYLMRLASAALAALCLALGLRSVAESPRRRWTTLGVAVALTPMAVFVNSTVNPNALETSAGLGLWLTLVVALRDPDPALATRRWWRAGVLVVLLVNAKAFSPLYLAIIVLAAVALAGWRPLRRALADRRSWPGIVLGVAGSAAAVLWTLRAGAVSGAGVTRFPELDTARALNNVLRLTTFYLEGQMGRFGWLDTPAPGTVYLLLAAGLGVLVVLALAAGRGREVAVLAVVMLLVVALPVVLQVPNATQVGLPWQGRYLMAVSVGVPLLAGLVLDRRLAPGSTPWAGRAAGIVLGAVGVAHVMSFWENLRRYVAGTDAPWFEPVENPWTPALPEPVLLAAAVAATVATLVLLGWLGSGHRPEPAEDPAREHVGS